MSLALIVAFVAAIGLGLTTIAAMTAWGFHRRPVALVLGAVAFWGGLALAADRVDGALALAIAWGCSAAVGVALAALGRQRAGSEHP